ncbi:MAG: 30S ribosomal protein S27ae [Candidatus Micrarchaeia archaeon]|jgi:ubiquitin-small subunit ribosomal protein S27Ae
MAEKKKERKTKAYKKKRACPKCGPGTALAEHKNRSHCGKCGYSETKKKDA